MTDFVQGEHIVLQASLYKDGWKTHRCLNFGSQAKKNPSIPSGRHDLVVTVSDWLGNKTAHSVSLKVDNALPLAPRIKPATDGQGGPGGAGGFGGGAGGKGG